MASPKLEAEVGPPPAQEGQASDRGGQAKGKCGEQERKGGIAWAGKREEEGRESLQSPEPWATLTSDPRARPRCRLSRNHCSSWGSREQTFTTQTLCDPPGHPPSTQPSDDSSTQDI